MSMFAACSNKFTWNLYYKTFTVVICARVFVPGKPLQISIIIAGKAGAY